MNVGGELKFEKFFLVARTPSGDDEVDLQTSSGGTVHHIQKNGLFPLIQECTLETVQRLSSDLIQTQITQAICRKNKALEDQVQSLQKQVESHMKDPTGHEITDGPDSME